MSNWEIKQLGSICDVLDKLRKPITKRDRVAGEFPYYGATGILDYVADYIFDEQLILIGEDGAKWSAGENTAFIANGKYWVNNHAHVIRPHKDEVIDNWLVYFLNHSDLSEFITGLTVPKLNQAKMRSIPVPVPSLAEQARIVSILDQCFAAIDKAKENAEKNLDNARELFESYLNRVFSRAAGDWPDATLEECCEQIFAGGDVPKDRVSKERTSTYGVPVYSNGAKNSGLYGYTDIPRVTKQCVTVSARGTIGYSAVRTEPFLPVVRLVVLIPRECLNVRFLHYSFRHLGVGNVSVHQSHG